MSATASSTPTLASTLYNYEQSVHAVKSKPRLRWRMGIKCLDRDLPAGVFRGGGIVGVAGVGELHDRSLSIVHNLIATHLQINTPSISTSTSPTTSVFILEPPTTPTQNTSLVRIYNTLLTTQTADHKLPSAVVSNHDPESLLSSISLLPYLDQVGISQSLSEISDTLHQQRQQHGQLSTNTDATTGTIILLRNLHTTLHTHLHFQSRTSGLGSGSTTTANTQTLALLSQILRQIKRLVRTFRDVLVIIELGVCEDRGMSVGDGTSVANGDGNETLGLRSAFTSAEGRRLRFGLDVDGRGRRGIGSGEMEIVRLLRDTLGTILVLHYGFGIVVENEIEKKEEAEGKGGKCIVEVVEDSDCDVEEGRLGAWCVWDE